MTKTMAINYQLSDNSVVSVSFHESCIQRSEPQKAVLSIPKRNKCSNDIQKQKWYHQRTTKILDEI